MFRRKKRQAPQQQPKAKVAPPASGASRVKASLLSLEQRLMFDAAAAATAAEVNQEQVAQEQAEEAVSSEGSGGEPTAAETESQELLQAITSYSPGESTTEVVFVDPTVPNYQELLSGMDPNIEVIMLDSGQDGVEQIAAALSGRTGIDAIHIISHGAEGQLNLGIGTLTQESMRGQYADELATIQQALSEQADLLVYGCNFAEGKVGQEAITLLSQLTGADVAASTDATGFTDLGGDWDLEVQTGSIETQVAINYETQMDWVGLLDISTGLLGQWTFDANATDSSGNSNDGTLTNGASIDTTTATNIVGTGKLSLDGTNDYVDLTAHLTDFSGLTQGTISAWVKTTSTSGVIFSSNDIADYSSGTVMWINAGRLGFAVYENNTALLDVTTTASINDGNWHLVTVTNGTSGNTLYIDGVQATVTYNTGSAATDRFFDDVTGEGTLYIGRDQRSGGSTYFNGAIDDVRFYNRVLTGGDVAQLYATSNAAPVVTVDPTDVNFNEQSPFGIDVNLTITDIDSGTLSGATVRISANYESGVDGLAFTDQNGISGIWNSTTGTLTLSGTASVADYQAALRSIAFYNYSDTPSTLTRTIEWVITDGTYPSTAVYRNITVSAVNDAPTITTLSGDSLSYSEGDGAVVIEQGGNALVADVDSANLDTGTLTVSFTAGSDAAEDVLGIRNQGTGAGQIGVSGSNITYGGTTIGTFTGGSGGTNLVITFNSNATPTAVTALIKNITFQDTDASAPTTGARTVRFVLTDGDGGTSANYDTTVTVNAVNDPTVVTGGTSGSGTEDTTLTGTLTATDNDGLSDGTVFSVSTGATNGTASIDPATGLWSYTPTADWHGSDSFTVTITDDAGNTTAQVISVTVTPVNDAPTDLSLSSNTVAENAANGTVVGTVSGTDPDTSDTKAYSFTDSAGGRFAINSSTGQITVADGSLLNYESATNHTVTVRVTDSGGLTYDETFTINLTNVNEAPTGADATVTLTEDTPQALTPANFGFTDVDAGDSLSAVRIDTLPGAGALTLSGAAVTAGQVIAVADIAAGNLLFTPAADATGTGYANLTFSVRDSNSTYDAAPNTLTIDVTAVNDAPVNTVPGAQSVAEDTPLALSGISVTDVDGNLSTVQLGVLNGTLNVTLSGGATISAGNNGTNTLTLSGSQVDINATLATLVYQGNLNYNGADTLTVTSTDTNSGTDVDTVALTVTAVNDATVMTGGTSGSSNEDTTVTGTLTATDAEGLSDGTVFSVTGAATQGTASIDPATGLWSYSPTADWHGTDSFTVTITDDAGNTTTQVITVTVTAVNDAPLLVTNTGSTVAEGGTDIIDASELAVTDVEQAAVQLTYTIGTGPASGRLELTTAPGLSATTFTQADIAANRLIYIHDGSETTSDSFTFTVSDGAGGALGTTTMTLTITPVNDTPTITSDGGASTAAINVAENVSAVTIVTGADVDLPAQALTYNISGGADQALFTIDASTGALNFSAPPDFEVATDANGDHVYVVQVQVIDSQGASTTQMIQVTVTDVAETVVAPANVLTIPPVLLSLRESEKRSQPVVIERNELPASLSTTTTEQPAKPTEAVVRPGSEMMPSGTPVEAPTFIKQEDIRRYDTAKLEPVMPRWDDSSAASPFTIMPVEPEQPIDSKLPEDQPSISDVLLVKLDAMAKSLEEEVGVEQEHEMMVTRVAALGGTTLSVGFVVWAVRSSAILASCLTTLPVWKSFDPLAVTKLSRQERDRRRQATDAAQRQEQDEFGGLEKFF